MPFSGIERDVKRAIDALASNHSIVNDGVCLLGGERCTRDRHDASEGHHRSNIMLLEPINIHRQLQVSYSPDNGWASAGWASMFG